MTPGIPTDVSYKALKEGEKNQSFLLGLIKMKRRAKVGKKITSHYQELHTYFLSSLLAYCPMVFEKLAKKKSSWVAGTVLERFSM